MNGKSLNIIEEKLARLREVLPEAFAEGAIDWEKLRVMLTRDGEFKDERYHLNWAGKTEAYRALQSPTTATLAPCREESVGFDGARHVFIEGENLTVLKVLQKACFGKVKMIYIDPPYNTGNDHFIYPDRFAMSKKGYQKRVGDMDDDGRLTREDLFRKNSRDNGHYHSNWLSMIYPRLFLARNLLRDDGVIFVSIDDNEAHNLRLVMNEIFGEENFVGVVAWKKTSGDNKPSFAFTHDNILIYGKMTNEIPRQALDERQRQQYKNPDNDPRGDWAESDYRSKWTKLERKNLYYAIKNPNTGEEIYPDTHSDSPRVWGCSKETHLENEKDGLVWWGGDGKSKEPRKKRFLSSHKGTNVRSVWLDAGTNDDASRELNLLFPDAKGIFDNPKPVSLLKKILSVCQSTDGIFLDFFAGSCTTAHAVLELNKEDGGKRKFICVQMPEACDEKSEARKAGFKTIADIGKERIRRVIKNGRLNAGLKVFKLRESNFKLWRGDVQDAAELAAQMQLHTDPLVDGAEEEDILYELLLKSGVSLTAPLRDHGGWWLAEDAGAKIAVALQRIDAATLKDILAAEPDKVITLDRLFQGNDQLKTNTALQMNDAGVGFEVV
ncbi:MAG: site-specific DNA-methyltransferase [Gammaproteobacteria bacterium]|nr:site-specific DNA-methyltransferase [Gammaproteobacteria bacterium]